MVESKVCPDCERELPAAEFWISRRTKDGLHPYCKACDKARVARYRAANHEQVLAGKARYRAENPDKTRAATRRCYQAKRDYYYEQTRANQRAHPARTRSYKQAWKRRNPDRVQENRMRYLARKQAATVEPVDYTAIWEQAQGVCYLCGQALARDDVHFDHVVPLSKGGTHTADNIRPTHAVCNMRKNDKLITCLPSDSVL